MNSVTKWQERQLMDCPANGPGSTPIGVVTCGDDGVAHGKWFVDASHVFGKIFGEAGVQKIPAHRYFPVPRRPLLPQADQGLSRSHNRPCLWRRSTTPPKLCSTCFRACASSSLCLAGRFARIGRRSGSKLFKYAISCHRMGSGSATHVGMPFARIPFFNSQNISPSVACRRRVLRRLGMFAATSGVFAVARRTVVDE